MKIGLIVTKSQAFGHAVEPGKNALHVDLKALSAEDRALLDEAVSQNGESYDLCNVLYCATGFSEGAAAIDHGRVLADGIFPTLRAAAAVRDVSRAAALEEGRRIAALPIETEKHVPTDYGMVFAACAEANSWRVRRMAHLKAESARASVAAAEVWLAQIEGQTGWRNVPVRELAAQCREADALVRKGEKILDARRAAEDAGRAAVVAAFCRANGMAKVAAMAEAGYEVDGHLKTCLHQLVSAAVNTLPGNLRVLAKPAESDEWRARSSPSAAAWDAAQAVGALELVSQARIVWAVWSEDADDQEQGEVVVARVLAPWPHASGWDMQVEIVGEGFAA